MNKLTLYIIGICLIASSCTKELDKDPIGILTGDQVLVDPTEGSVTSGVENVYRLLSNTINQFRSNDPWAQGVFIRPDFLLEDIASGDVMKKWNSDDDQFWMDQIANYNFTGNNQAFIGSWKFDYEGIARANVAIFQLTDPEILSKINMNEDKRKQLLAEAYFLRSFYYFNLIKYFGDVPMVLTPLTSFQEAYAVAVRVPKVTIYEQIKGDLEIAVDYFPNDRYSNQSQKWRASKGAAVALLAKIALFEQDWPEVISKVNDLEGLGYYSLNTNFFDSFDNEKIATETENIFYFEHESDILPLKGNGVTAMLEWGFLAPTSNLLNAFETNDPRRTQTVNTSDRTVYKLAGAQDRRFFGNDNSTVNKVFIRYTDVLLWKAEALIMSQQIPAGIAIINTVRTRARAGNSTILADRATTGISETTAMQWLQHERRVELSYECHRLSDLRRWGIAQATLTAMGKPFETKHILFPIPTSEVDKTVGKITQNDGY